LAASGGALAVGLRITSPINNAALDYDRSTAGTFQGAPFLGRYFFPGKN
jgi:hypothetical protein